MLLAKYLCPSRLTEEGRKLPCSRIWVACKKGGPIYVKGLRWIVRNGDSVNMWMDFWLPNGRLRELIVGPLNCGEEVLTVRQWFDENHGWLPSSISFELPASVLSTIKATPFSYIPQANDISCGPIPKMAVSPYKLLTSVHNYYFTFHGTHFL